MPRSQPKIDPDALMDPDQFQPQAPARSPRVAEYAEEAARLSRAVLEQWSPQRVRYGPHQNQMLDIFSGDGKSGLRPALVFFHGGAWSAGYLWWSSFMAPGIEKIGGILVTPTYRLGPEYRFPTPLEDVAQAIAWVWNNAGDIGVDRQRIFVGGHSAGGHLSTLATLKPGTLSREGAPDDLVKGCFALSSSFNLHYPNPAPGSGEERTYKTLLARAEDDRIASPIEYLSRDCPPMHMACGAGDFERIIRTNHEMADALAARNIEASLEIWENMDHFDTHLALADPRHHWYQEIGAAFARNT